MFKGYCYFEDGTYLQGIELKNEKEAINYAFTKGKIFPLVRIIDEDDFIAIEIKDRKVIFPLELQHLL